MFTVTILRVRRILLFIQIMNKKNGGQRRHFCRELLKITNTYLKIAKSKQKITLHMLCIWVTSLFHQFFTGALLQVCVSQTNNWTCFLCGESLFSWIRVRSFFESLIDSLTLSSHQYWLLLNIWRDIREIQLERESRERTEQKQSSSKCMLREFIQSFMTTTHKRHKSTLLYHFMPPGQTY